MVFSEQGGLLDVVVSPGFAADQLVYLTYAEPRPTAAAALRSRGQGWFAAARGRGWRACRCIWRDPAGGDGGQFGAIVVFAPDGKSLFLTSGERQRFTPAQDPSQPIGKILHLTLDGKPVGGQRLPANAGAPTVTITDPPEDTEAAKHAQGRPITLPGPNLTPAETWTLGHRNPYGLAFAPMDDCGKRKWVRVAAMSST